LSSAPPSAQDVTISSSNPSVVLLSADANVTGSASITLNTATTSVGSYVLQGLSKGSADISFSSSNYTSTSVTVTVGDSGFIISSPSSIDTSVFSPDTSLRIASYLLRSDTLGILQSQPIRAGFSVDVPLVVADNSVGVLTSSPVRFSGNESLVVTAFSPVASGTTSVSVSQPNGFSTPSNFTSIEAQVSAPSITLGDVTVGKNLQQSINVVLEAAPPSPVDVTVSVSSGAIAIVSDSAGTVGSDTVTFSNVTSSFVGTLTVQGLEVGSTQLNVSAPGYVSDTADVSVEPAGFIISTPNDFTTSTTPRSISIQSYRLDPVTLNWSARQAIRAGLDVTVDLSNSNTSVGSLSSTSLSITGGMFSAQSTFTAFCI